MHPFFLTDQPEFTRHPQNVTKNEGEDVTLYCNATGVPKPSITWQKDNLTINPSADFRISISQDGTQLNITNLNRTDIGEYKCVANNSEGSNTSTPATLTVKCMERILFLL